MTDKSQILEAWIMTEHLSSGDVNSKDRSLFAIDAEAQRDYHTFFRNLLAEKLRGRRTAQSGIVLYCGIFDFQCVIDLLRRGFGLQPTDEDIRIGEKFTMALCFDSRLTLLADKTCYTESAYIRQKGRLPRESEFRDFEAELQTSLSQIFEETGKDPEKFQAAMEKMLRRYSIAPESCRVQIIANIDNDAANLHSFYIEDLELAKSTATDNLDAYLFGCKAPHVNLDSKSDSPLFAPALFRQILAPDHYPVGRFPSNTKYALSLMQQVAVNLAAGYDSQTIRSVNGPPGTGKTTLLKDIFAELVVRQAISVAALSDRSLTGTPDTVYYKKASVARLPQNVAENNIIVASTNNGAVRNIVNELPLTKEIDSALVSELTEADYFREIANGKADAKWETDETGKPHEVLTLEPAADPQFWGLFSMEGGKAANCDLILKKLKHVVRYLEEDYQPVPGVYAEFRAAHETVCRLREKAAALAKQYPNYENAKAHLQQYRDEAAALDQKVAQVKQTAAQTLRAVQANLQADTEPLIRQRTELTERIAKAERYLEDAKQYQRTVIQMEKPKLFASAAEKQAYQKKLASASENINGFLTEIRTLTAEEQTLTAKIKQLESDAKANADRLLKEQQSLENSRAQAAAEIRKRESMIRILEEQFLQGGAEPLDLTKDYDALQLSNPWFDEQYRIAQSKLFIAALRVRKQFLFENRKNLKAAVMIWSKQKEYLDKKHLIGIAWDWINFAVPVISSTFASFGRMCRQLGAESMGHLFIDEAGQAVPQAAVGAILRSRHVMVVGDPSQIKPVLTLDAGVLSLLRQHFGITEQYLSDSASAQTLTDAASRYGYYRGAEQSDEAWIGIPLWVHRRCGYPMFTISNEISYGGMMVQGKPEFGSADWFNVRGTANNKYVQKQGDFLAELLENMMQENPKIGDRSEKDTVYVITPFANAAAKLAQRLQKIGFTRYDAQGKPSNVGTIHTFQGKEAPIVFLVLGADQQSSGAARWAVSEPNMMNVAATRAKQAFYIIGDKSLYLKCGSEVAEVTARIIRGYCEKHPPALQIEQIPEEPSEQPETAEHETAPQQPAPVRLTGTVKYVGNGSRARYAYIKGSDGSEYTVTEDEYAKTPDAAKIIRKGNKVSFEPDAQPERKPLAAEIRHAP